MASLPFRWFLCNECGKRSRTHDRKHKRAVARLCASCFQKLTNPRSRPCMKCGYYCEPLTQDDDETYYGWCHRCAKARKDEVLAKELRP